METSAVVVAGQAAEAVVAQQSLDVRRQRTARRQLGDEVTEAVS